MLGIEMRPCEIRFSKGVGAPEVAIVEKPRPRSCGAEG